MPLLFLLLTAAAPAQIPFTNSATLSVAFDGTNVLLRADFAQTDGAYTLLQADRLDALRLPTYAFQISNQIVDLGWVPASRTAQWTLTNAPDAARFFRLQLEPFLTRGRARVFVGGPLDFDAMREVYGDITNNAQDTHITGTGTNTTPMIFKQPVEVWLDNLGNYDTNGVLIGSNQGRLSGRFGVSYLYTIDEYAPGFGAWEHIDEYNSPSNDFRVPFIAETNATQRQLHLWNCEAQLYHDVNDYRNRFLTDTFIDELNLPPELQANHKQRKFRPDLDLSWLFGPGAQAYPQIPGLGHTEKFKVEGLRLFPLANYLQVDSRTRGPHPSFQGLPPMALTYDSGVCVGDYAGLVGFWVLGTNTGFPLDGLTDVFTTVLSPVSDGLSAWVAYRYEGDPEIYRYLHYCLRIWDGRACGGTNIPCAKGESIRNVMMFDEANTSRDGVYPFSHPSSLSNHDGPVGSDLASLYIAAILYDIAYEAGLGLHKTDLLIWKTISLVTDNMNFPMRAFGAKVQEAARALWPDPRPARAGLSLYEEDINDVLTSRGIPLNGVADFRSNLPSAASMYIEIPSTSGLRPFASAHPSSHPGANFYGSHSFAVYRYEETNASSAYVAYQFYKHSKFGPCDRLAFTDGSFTTTSATPFNWSYNNDGTYYGELTDRELGNVVLLLPGRTNHWMSSRQRCPNEATGFYAEDVRPFGFRVIQATPNGFSFTATALSETPTNKTYQLTIVDPSLTSVGPADYQWSFTNHLGVVETSSGPVANCTAQKDEPFTIHIERTRSGATDTLTLRERGNDLERSGGNAFVRNLVPYRLAVARARFGFSGLW